ncbi:MAG: MarR family transcriptional regulator [Rhizobiales bacterium]|nr:MarR family transcriptional regulator [Hyphomicrobiales bacterium]
MKSPPHRKSDHGVAPSREQILGLAVNTLGRNLVWNLAQRTAPRGVLPGQYPIIAWLIRLPHSTQAELSRLVGIEQPTMAATLRRMERDGLIRRSADPDHSRKSRVFLTARGKKLSLVIHAAALEVEEIAMTGLDESEVQAFFRLARAMNRNLEAERRRTERALDSSSARRAKQNREMGALAELAFAASFGPSQRHVDGGVRGKVSSRSKGRSAAGAGLDSRRRPNDHS